MINELNITKEYYENLLEINKCEPSNIESNSTSKSNDNNEVNFLNKKRNPDKNQDKILLNKISDIPFNSIENQKTYIINEIPIAEKINESDIIELKNDMDDDISDFIKNNNIFNSNIFF